jgi:hypothetical protein
MDSRLPFLRSPHRSEGQLFLFLFLFTAKGCLGFYKVFSEKNIYNRNDFFAIMA